MTYAKNSTIYPKLVYTSHDTKRKHEELHSKSDPRTPFERDRSRVIHSSAFRRLQGKTQVFTAGEGDFYRTRLTHSLEVAQIGKGLALRLGADTELVETICLLHDIGHPPFGHAGEDALKKLMAEYGGFEANAQNIRLITLLEKKNHAYDGLNLTRGVIDGQLHYKTFYPNDTDKFVYKADERWVKWASDEASNSMLIPNASEKSFECQIMDWADEVAYAIHDLEDSIHARYIDASAFDLADRRLVAAIKTTKTKFPSDANRVGSIFEALKKRILGLNPSLSQIYRHVEHRERRGRRKEMTTDLIGRYINGVTRTEKKPISDEVVSSRYSYDVDIPIDLQIEVKLINNILFQYVFKAPQVMMLEEKGKYVIRRLFETFVGCPELLPEDWQKSLDEDMDENPLERKVSDYISGMTDSYAQLTYSKLFLPNSGSISDIY